MIDYDSNILTNFNQRHTPLGITLVKMERPSKQQIRSLTSTMRKLDHPIEIFNKYPIASGHNLSNLIKFYESKQNADLERLTQDPLFLPNQISMGSQNTLLQQIKQQITLAPTLTNDQLAKQLLQLSEFQQMSLASLLFLITEARATFTSKFVSKLTKKQIDVMFKSKSLPSPWTKQNIQQILQERVVLGDDNHQEATLQQMWEDYQQVKKKENEYEEQKDDKKQKKKSKPTKEEMEEYERKKRDFENYVRDKEAEFEDQMKQKKNFEEYKSKKDKGRKRPE